jgi:hypothetical protein
MSRRSIGGCRSVYKLKMGVELLRPRLSRLVLGPNMVETVVILVICRLQGIVVKRWGESEVVIL